VPDTRLLAWNIAHRRATWSALCELAQRDQVDFALLTEAGPPPGDLDMQITTWPSADDKAEWHTWDRPDSPGRRWCAAIVRFPWTRFDLRPQVRVPLSHANWDDPAISHPGQFAVARIHPLDGDHDSAPVATLVSLYGVWDSLPSRRKFIFAEATLHRAISDLTPLLLEDHPVVVAGDLNILSGYGTYNDWASHNDTVFERFAAFGLQLAGPYRPSDVAYIDCVCGDAAACRHTPTRESPPLQLDWVLCDLPAPQIRSWTLPIDADLSDHAPVRIDVEL
jgi:hypothetical protein